jgi:subtilase family serine protease
MARSVRRRLGAGLTAGLVVAGVSIVATTAYASTTPGPDTLEPVQAGLSGSALPGASLLGTTSSDTQETVSFVLRANNLNQLKSAVTHGDYHAGNFLSVHQFAGEYGQGAVASELTAYLAKYGITTTTDKNDLDVVASGTAGDFQKALSVGQKEYRVPALHGLLGAASVPAQTVHAATGAPQLPKYIADHVLSILGLTNYSTFTSQASHVSTNVVKRASGNSTTCEVLSSLPDACNLPSDFANHYGLSPLYKSANGTGQTTAIVTLAALDPTAPQTFWSTVAGVKSTGRTVTTDDVDGGPGLPSASAGSGETDLDVEQAGALAPGANVIVYQAPNTDSGFADAYFQAASDNTASSVSASWAESETYLAYSIAAGTESPSYEAAFDEAFLELAAQGQSAFTASGDWAAYTATADQGTTNLSVAASADSPYITAAGGTTLPWSTTLSNTLGTAVAKVDVPAERTWGWDYLWQPVATADGESFADSAISQVTGSGGGYSTIESRPAYQDKVPGIGNYNAIEELTPADYITQKGTNLVEPTEFTVNSSPKIVSGYSNGRAVPDVSADADPYSGYLLYAPSNLESGSAPLQGGWGGTSFVAPQLNGSAALIDSYLGHRVGFWNPAIYGFAASGNSPFKPLNAVGASNDNLYYTGGGAGSRYNAGSGLGIPNLAKLAEDFGQS